MIYRPEEVKTLLHRAAKHGFFCSTYRRYPMGALLIVRNNVYFGANQDKTHPKSNARYFTIHAELDMLRHTRGVQETDGAVAFIARYRKDRTFGLARPCPGCMTLLFGYRLLRVYWSAHPDTYGYLDLK